LHRQLEGAVRKRFRQPVKLVRSTFLTGGAAPTSTKSARDDAANDTKISPGYWERHNTIAMKIQKGKRLPVKFDDLFSPPIEHEAMGANRA
jgi:hypothetical protein